MFTFNIGEDANIISLCVGLFMHCFMYVLLLEKNLLKYLVRLRFLTLFAIYSQKKGQERWK